MQYYRDKIQNLQEVLDSQEQEQELAFYKKFFYFSIGAINTFLFIFFYSVIIFILIWFTHVFQKVELSDKIQLCIFAVTFLGLIITIAHKYIKYYGSPEKILRRQKRKAPNEQMSHQGLSVSNGRILAN